MKNFKKKSDKTTAKVALVTGASTGLGKSLAFKLANEGIHLILVARREAILKKIKEDIITQYNVAVKIVKADLTIKEDLDKVIDIMRRNDDFQILINNAGIAGHDQIFHQSDFLKIESMLNTNVLAPIKLAHSAIKQLVEKKSGMIVNICSLASLKPLPYSIIYGSSKSFLHQFSLSLAEELKNTNVKIFSICPGNIKTDMLAIEFEKPINNIKTSNFIMSSERCANKIVNHILSKQKVIFYPGLTNKMLAVLLKMLPIWLLSKLEQATKK